MQVSPGTRPAERGGRRLAARAKGEQMVFERGQAGELARREAPTGNTFDTIADSWATPFEVDSYYIPWSQPKAHTLWSESEIIGASIANTITAHSNAPQVKLTLWAPYPVADASWMPVVRDEIWEKTVGTVGGVATFDLSREDVQVGRYELTTVGGTLQQRSVYFQAIDAATALRSGSTRDNTNYYRMYGFSSLVDKSVLELYSKTADGVETKLPSSYLENAAEGWIFEYGAAHKTAIADGAFILRKLQMEAMRGYTFEVAFSQTPHFLVGSKAPATWGSSPEAQNIGPWPTWPVPGGLGSSNGSIDNDSGARPAVPNRTTDVLTPEAAGALFNHLDTLENGDTLTITFATAMNPNDFGIGFDFSDDFSLAWASDNQSVTVTFNNVTKLGGGERNLYINRLRDGGSNFIAAPIHHSFTVLSLIETSGIRNKNGQADIDFAIKSANGKGYTVYLSEWNEESNEQGHYEACGEVNYNEHGAHIKGLANGKTYWAYVVYSESGVAVARSRPVQLNPAK